MVQFFSPPVTFENFHLQMLFHGQNELSEGRGVRYLILVRSVEEQTALCPKFIYKQSVVLATAWKGSGRSGGTRHLLSALGASEFVERFRASI